MRKGIVSDTQSNEENVTKREKKGDESVKKKRKISEVDDAESEGETEENASAKKSELMSKRERVKTTCTVSARMKQVVEQMILCTKEQYDIAMQQTTIFAFKSLQSVIVSCFLEEMRRENPPLMQNKAALLQLIDDAYERSQSLIMLHSNTV